MVFRSAAATAVDDISVRRNKNCKTCRVEHEAESFGSLVVKTQLQPRKIYFINLDGLSIELLATNERGSGVSDAIAAGSKTIIPFVILVYY